MAFEKMNAYILQFGNFEKKSKKKKNNNNNNNKGLYILLRGDILLRGNPFYT